VECSPADDYYCLCLSTAHLRLGQPAEALRAMRRSAQIRPRHAAYRHLVGWLLEMTGEEAEAREHCRRAGTLCAYDTEFVRRVQVRAGQREAAEPEPVPEYWAHDEAPPDLRWQDPA
jgi:hypothetical protein